jgi:hypothetical protein
MYAGRAQRGAGLGERQLAARARGRQRLGDPEVRDDGGARRKQHVGGLDVAMYDAVVVRIGQRLREVAQDLHGLVERHGTRLNARAQGIPRHERHGVEGEPITRDAGIEDRDDVRLLQRRRQPNLAREPLGAQADGALWREHLDDDIAIEGGVVREEHACHATARQFTLERVAAT